MRQKRTILPVSMLIPLIEAEQLRQQKELHNPTNRQFSKYP